MLLLSIGEKRGDRRGEFLARGEPAIGDSKRCACSFTKESQLTSTPVSLGKRRSKIGIILGGKADEGFFLAGGVVELKPGDAGLDCEPRSDILMAGARR